MLLKRIASGCLRQSCDDENTKWFRRLQNSDFNVSDINCEGIPKINREAKVLKFVR